MKKIIFATTVILNFFSVGQAAPVAGDAYIQMNDTLKKLERQRIQRQIEEVYNAVKKM